MVGIMRIAYTNLGGKRAYLDDSHMHCRKMYSAYQLVIEVFSQFRITDMLLICYVVLEKVQEQLQEVCVD